MKEKEQWQAKGVMSVNTTKGDQAGEGPIQLTQMQTRADLLTEGVDKRKKKKKERNLINTPIL